MNKTYIIVDLEATCYDKIDINKPKGFINEIIEIGAVKCNENGDIIDEFQCFVKPKKFPILSNFCKELTSIKQEDIDIAYFFPDCMHSFILWATNIDYDYNNVNDIINSNVTFISWGEYDRRQFRNDSELSNINENWISSLNHKSLKHLHSEWNKLNYPKGIGLGRACKFENIEFTGTAHRGIDDAKNIAKIFKKYITKF
jgi:inhibitor of KinA sporulation pathway (predicted exonuclease)